MKRWEKLPEDMKTAEVRPYYDLLKKKSFSRILKRLFDIVASLLLIILLSPVMAVIAIWIKLDSKGPVLYKSKRVTTYNQDFMIYKFRTMVTDADKKGALITVSGDNRITRVGKKIRSARLDEIPQLFNVFTGKMSFVGTRPEVRRYVDAYTPEMMATLLLPAGITSKASIAYRDEDQKMARLTADGLSLDRAYIEHILPEKMKYNLDYIKEFNFLGDIVTCIKTVL
ncbi:MAG: sugar transferase [Acutalibacteraceae bacterium]|nr:sugar transferase [Acutalibacteraceae bacterium]